MASEGLIYLFLLRIITSWTEPKNMGKTINSKAFEMCGSVSPDGKYLFFSRFFEGTSNIYWVSTNIIEQLKSI
jgi:hypothetical protein